MLLEEERAGIFDIEHLIKVLSVENNKIELMNLLYSLKANNKRIVGVKAPKGMTLLNYCGIDTTLLDFVTEKSKLKIDRFTPGGNIPVFSDDMLISKRPDYALLLAWNFAEEIINNLDEYKKLGGKFIIPIPNPKII